MPRRYARDDAVGRDHAEDVDILDYRLRQRVEDIHALLGLPRPHHLPVGRLEGNDLAKAEVLDSRGSMSALRKLAACTGRGPAERPREESARGRGSRTKMRIASSGVMPFCQRGASRHSSLKGSRLRVGRRRARF